MKTHRMNAHRERRIGGSVVRCGLPKAELRARRNGLTENS